MENQLTVSPFKKLASEFGSTENKARLAVAGTLPIAISYLFLITEGAGGNFVALSWPGMLLAAPFGYDVLTSLIGKSK